MRMRSAGFRADVRDMGTVLSQALPALAKSLSAGGAAEDLLRALTEHTPVGVFLSDTDGSCRYVNRRWCELAGVGPEKALGDGWAAAIHPDDRDRVEREWAAAAGEERDSVISYRFRRPDGTVSWIDGYASAFHGENGRLVGWVGACLDVTSHRREHLRLRLQAETDPLTGLPNRRAFDELLEAALTELARGGEPVGVVILDVDHFKDVNDTHGHRAGDETLIAVAGKLGERLRRTDVAARVGGDEFAILVREDDPSLVGDHLVAALRTLDLASGTITASAGAALARPGDSAETLLAAADGALYEAKQRGRDRVEPAAILAA
jgi:diguanylate cyclase (GGDEF)-like protein/PAS domain S-box-containing protein